MSEPRRVWLVQGCHSPERPFVVMSQVDCCCRSSCAFAASIDIGLLGGGLGVRVLVYR